MTTGISGVPSHHREEKGLVEEIPPAVFKEMLHRVENGVAGILPTVLVEQPPTSVLSLNSLKVLAKAENAKRHR